VRVLFILKQMGYVRHFTTVVRGLAERGHVVRLAAQDGEHGLPPALEGVPNVTITSADRKRRDQWREYVSLIRRSSDYLRYLTPPFAGARKLRARAYDKLVQTLSNGERRPAPGDAEAGLTLTTDEQARLRTVLRMVNDLIPSDASLEAWLKSEAPDIVLITPLIDIGSSQADYVRACHAAGIPVVLLLFSWDNLSTKGLVHEMPDRLLVWNALQVKEAIELHGVPRKRVVATGAPRFDEFFALQPSVDREAYCGHLGLDATLPTVVYLGSSKFIAEDHEDEYIARWIAAVRATPGLERANILVKPHPDLNRTWGGEGDRVSWTAPGGEVRLRVTRPFAGERITVARTTFSGAQFLYDCLYHSEAVVGLNTSAELEAAIVGRPVLTIKVADALADGQSGTLHFHYLLKEHGGFVQSASTLDEHCRALARAVAGEVDREAIRRFVGEFLRPGGLEVPATSHVVHEIERVFRRAQKRKAGAEAEHVAVESAAPAASSGDGDVVTLDYTPIAIQLRVTSREERLYRARACTKEPWTVEWLERMVGRATVLYDIGANVGAFTLIAARREPSATVVAFEPGYASFAHLCENIVGNGCQHNVIPIQLPLWSETALVTMRYRSLAPGQSRHSVRPWRGPQRASPHAERYEQPMLGTRLDDVVRQYKLPLPSAIKLDVDGAEIDVLRGAAETLTHPALASLLIEIAAEVETEAFELLAQAGFGCVRRIDRTKEGAPVYAEFRRRS
jgi:FkbM family methyltransferase